MTAGTPGPGQDLPGPEARQLAALRALYPDWDIWVVPTPWDLAGPLLWCARIAGAAVATCHGKDPGILGYAIRRYTRRLDEHIDAARAQLAGPGALTPARRAMLGHQLAAMTALQARTRPPAAPPPPPGPGRG